MIVYDVEGVSFCYPGRLEPANQDISLQIAAGEVFGLLGDNGAGKTTLIRHAARVNLLPAAAGRILLFGEPVNRHPLPVPLNVGYMPQESQSLNNLTVGEALFFTAHLRGLSRAEARAHVAEQLALWQIERKINWRLA